MRIKRTLRLVFALLLIAMLPVRGFAATAHCGRDGRAVHAVHSSHCHEAVHLHGCGDCCGVAALAIAPSLMFSRPPVAHISAPPAHDPPTLDLDRLERPPRPAV